MKQCFKCKIEKPLTDFYPHKRMLDGHLNKCIDCTKKDVRERESVLKRDIGWIEKERTRGRKKYHRLYTGRGKANPKNNKKYHLRFPEKKRATLASQRLVSPTLGLEKHHWSYNDEHFEDIIWMTKKQHMKAHRFLIYDQERKMYRRYDTNELLDTKDRHWEFIDDCIDQKED